MVHPDYNDQVVVRCNDLNEVVITVNQQEFIADLMFMNQFAVCRDCGGIRNWDYFFPEAQRLAM